MVTNTNTEPTSSTPLNKGSKKGQSYLPDQSVVATIPQDDDERVLAQIGYKQVRIYSWLKDLIF